MKHTRWLRAVPALLMVGGLGVAWLVIPGLQRNASASGRIVDDRFLEEEARVGAKLYAPTWLPHDGRPGPVGTRQGVYRILCDYTDPTTSPICILAQERRTPERDRYHERRMLRRADARAQISAGKTGYFITGESGERRLFWFESDMALILSSNVLTDPELLRVAASTRNK